MSEAVSGMFTLGGWQGMEWQAKVRVQNESTMSGLLKQAATLDFATC